MLNMSSKVLLNIIQVTLRKK